MTTSFDAGKAPTREPDDVLSSGVIESSHTQTELERVAAEIVRLCEFVGVRRVRLFATADEPDGRSLWLLAHSDALSAIPSDSLRVPLDGAGSAPVAARTRTVQLVPGVESLHGDAARASDDAATAGDAVTTVSVPLVAHGEVVGVLSWVLAADERIANGPHAALRASAEVFAAGLYGAQTGERERRARARLGREAAVNKALEASRAVEQSLRTTELSETRWVPLECRPTDPCALVRAVVERRGGDLQGRTVRLELARGLPSLWVDRSRIEQVLGNLIALAVKHSRAGSEVGIEAARRAGVVEFAVSNRETGHEKDSLPQLFGRAQRSSTRGSDAATGLGLGLFVVRRLIEAHGGRIWAESTPGERTTFRFTLPIMRP